MDVERRIIYEGVDSWEGEMTYQGITYMVEVGKGNKMWYMEVLQEGGGCSLFGRFFPIVNTLHSGAYPTLESALDAAANYILGLSTNTYLLG